MNILSFKFNIIIANIFLIKIFTYKFKNKIFIIMELFKQVFFY